MKKLIRSLVLILILGVTYAAPVMQPPPNSGMDSTTYSIYQSESKNEWLATGITFVVPSLGHAYAGNWGRSLPIVGTEVLGLIIMGSAVGSSNSSYGSLPAVDTSRSLLGGILFLGGRIWECFDAFDTAATYNRKQKSELGISVGLWDGIPVVVACISL